MDKVLKDKMFEVCTQDRMRSYRRGEGMGGGSTVLYLRYVHESCGWWSEGGWLVRF